MWTVKNQSPPPADGDHGAASALCPPRSCEPAPRFLSVSAVSLRPRAPHPSSSPAACQHPSSRARGSAAARTFPVGHLVLRGQPDPRRAEPERVPGWILPRPTGGAAHGAEGGERLCCPISGPRCLDHKPLRLDLPSQLLPPGPHSGPTTWQGLRESPLTHLPCGGI